VKSPICIFRGASPILNSKYTSSSYGMLLPSKDKTSAPWPIAGQSRNSEMNGNDPKRSVHLSSKNNRLCSTYQPYAFFKVPDRSPRGNTTKSGVSKPQIQSKWRDHELQVQLDKTNRGMWTPNLKQKNTWLTIQHSPITWQGKQAYSSILYTATIQHIINLSTQILRWHPLKPWHLSSLMLVTNQSISLQTTCVFT